MPREKKTSNSDQVNKSRSVSFAKSSVNRLVYAHLCSTAAISRHLLRSCPKYCARSLVGLGVGIREAVWNQNWWSLLSSLSLTHVSLYRDLQLVSWSQSTWSTKKVNSRERRQPAIICKKFSTLGRNQNYLASLAKSLSPHELLETLREKVIALQELGGMAAKEKIPSTSCD